MIEFVGDRRKVLSFVIDFMAMLMVTWISCSPKSENVFDLSFHKIL